MSSATRNADGTFALKHGSYEKGAPVKRTEDLYPHVLGHKTTIDATYCLAKMAIDLGIPGDFCECGVYAGAQSAAMARAIVDYEGFIDGATNRWWPWPDKVRRRVHLFDSFQGFPALTVRDADLRHAHTSEGGSAHSLKDTQRNMRTWGIPDELLVWHPGWFDDTMRPGPLGRLPFADLQSIAVLRLDADLYESTATALKYLYPLVSPGGWIIVDDWNLDGCRQAVLDYLSRNPAVETIAPVYWRKSA